MANGTQRREPRSPRRRLGDAARLLARRLLSTELDALRRVEGGLRAVDARVGSLETRLGPDALLTRTEEAAAAQPFVADARFGFFDDRSAGRVWGYESAGEPADVAVSFTDVFRGDESRVRELAMPYVDTLAPHGPVLDVGCGRGELLDLLTKRGVACVGVDSDRDMVERARTKGHDVVHADLVEYVRGLPNESVGAVAAMHVVEHLAIDRLRELLALLHDKLQRDGVFVIETVNPFAALGMRGFWVDPTHRTPLFPETLVVLCRAAGFSRAVAYDPRGSGDFAADRYRTAAYAVLARR